MSQKWIVSVGGRTYGPYTGGEMQDFASEGRLASHSLIARAEEGRFRPASQDPDIASLLPSLQPPAPRRNLPVVEKQAHRNFGQAGEPAMHGPSHYLIVAEMKSSSIAAIEEEIFRMGAAYPVLPQAWILASEMPIGALRNLLVQKLGKLDQLFITNASQDKIAWINLGMEAEIRVRRVWAKQPQRSAA
jgi:uncharacterized protein DUF4339